MPDHANIAAGGPVVIKIGGSTLGSHDTTLVDLVTLQKQGVPVVVIHGGGKIITQWMERAGTVPKFVRGLRVTDQPSMEIVAAVLTGLINKQLVSTMLQMGARCVGMSGVDGATLEAEIAEPELGLVGKVVKVNPQALEAAIKGGFIPMVSPVGIHRLDSSPNSGCLLNINGDTATGDVALALKASRLVFLTDVEGVMDSSGRVIPQLSARDAKMLLSSGVAKGGMIPKLEACLRALEAVPEANIVDGRQPRCLLNCLERKPIGTRIVR